MSGLALQLFDLGGQGQTILLKTLSGFVFNGIQYTNLIFLQTQTKSGQVDIATEAVAYVHQVLMKLINLQISLEGKGSTCLIKRNNDIAVCNHCV